MARSLINGHAHPTAGNGTSLPSISILDAIDHPSIWRSWFRRPETWKAWRVFLAALFGLPLDDEALALYRKCTGRTEPPAEGFNEAWLVVGRRGGKSFTLALVAVYLAVFKDWKPYLSPGEVGTVKIISVDRRQSRVIYRHCRSLLAQVPVLAPLVKKDDGDTIELTNNIAIEVQTASFRSVRGHTVIAGLCDELGFWRTDEGSANPDGEILAALRPAMSTVPGAMLLCASSPYARRGALWDAFRRYHGKDDAPVLVWHADTRTMNPTVRPYIITEAYEADEAKASAEYGAQFRSDLESYVPREVVDAAIIPGRYELPAVSGVVYQAFVDPSGGSADSMTLAVAHRDRDGRAIIDAVRERRPPFSPENAVDEFTAILRQYRISRVHGDRYAGEFVREPFRLRGIIYEIADRPKSDYYRDALPLLNSGKVELLDIPRLANQLCSLERRTSRGGKDSIDHPPGQMDDVANVVCAVAVILAARRGPLQVDDGFVQKSAIKNYATRHFPVNNPFQPRRII